LRDYDAEDLDFRLPYIVGQPPPPPAGTPTETPTKVDHRQYCSPIENQGALGSCTAQAVAGLVEFQERVKYKRYVDVSRLFVYKVARQLDGFRGDTGSYIRSAMKGLRLFGGPPERYWPYVIQDFDKDPPAFAFAYGQSLQAITYWRLDQRNRAREDVLRLAKTLLVNRLAVVFGFVVYSYGNERGEFPMPDKSSRPRGGHAVLAVGYDDAYRIGDSIGALLIRNSWGTGWGDGGYGWLPYGYVTDGLSSDFWTLIRKETLV
jgi:C1A family cysteine protease